MSEAYLAQQQPTLSWNTARGVWEKQGMANLLCEHLELFSETWPTSGTMRNGQVFALQTQGHRTTDSEFSSLPTPTTQDSSGICRDHGGDLLHEVTCGCSRSERRSLVNARALLRSPTASQGEGGALGEKVARERGNTVGIRDQAMDIAKANGGNVTRAEYNLMPTPTTQDGKNNAGPSQFERNTKPLNVEAVIASNTDWGRFEPAIRRWEQALGRPAPLPTKPDGKDGAHRLSSKFTEWMMGLSEGWITDAGLKRNDELKACGNGVVPQQAELALRELLKGTINGKSGE